MDEEKIKLRTILDLTVQEDDIDSLRGMLRMVVIETRKNGFSNEWRKYRILSEDLYSDLLRELNLMDEILKLP